VIPVNDAMLYVQPMYLQASGSNAAAPRLARVIVATNSEVVMAPSLAAAIDLLDGGPAPTGGELPVAEVSDGPEQVESPQVPVADLVGMSEAQLLDEAVATFDRGQDALASGDWSAYGEEQTRLKAILDLLAEEEPAPGATPAAAD
jgi:uncharacterized protein